MTSKERILKTIKHQEADRVPFTFKGSSEIYDKMLKYFETDDLEYFYEKLHLDAIRKVSPRYIGPEYRDYTFSPTYDEEGEDFWGVRRISVQYGTGIYHEVEFSPLAKAENVKDIERYRWPDSDSFDFSRIEDECTQWKEKSAIYAGDFNILTTAMYMRGFENILVDMVSSPQMAEAIFDKIAVVYLSYIEKEFVAGKGSIDIFFMGDDYGTQNGLLIRPEMWRRYIKPRLKQCYALAKKYNLRIFLHSCGSIKAIIPDLIEIGLDVLDPIQVRANDMNPKELKREFGKDLCFHGGIDIQHTLPYGSPAEVKGEVKERIAELASGGGYIISPSHNIQPDTPVENIMAMYEAAYEYGRYQKK